MSKIGMFFTKKINKIRNDKNLESKVQFLLFGLVGISNTLISYAIYVLIVTMNFHYLAGNIIGFLVSVLNSFYWNNKYVFVNRSSKKRSMLQTLGKTFIAYGFTGIILNSLLLILLVDQFHISKYISPLIILLVTIPLNFIINKKWSYKIDD